VPDDLRYIPPADRAEGEPGEGGCLRTEAEEQEAEATAPEILEAYRAEAREAEELLNPPPDQPQPTQAAADLQRLGRWPPVPTRAPLRAHFDQALRRGAWRAFGFSEDQGKRVPVGSPWREDLTYGKNGEMTDRRGRVYSETLFYRADTTETTNRAEETDAGTRKKTAPLGAKMVRWLDQLLAKDKRAAGYSLNHLADLYCEAHPPGPGEPDHHRYAMKVFKNPDKYRGRE